MIRLSNLVAVCLLSAVVPGVTSGAGVPSFRHERAVIPAALGANRLSLDATLLAGARPLRFAGNSFSGGLDDLRFYDPAGREVAYLLIPPPAPSESWQAGGVLPIPSSKEASGFEVDLGRALFVDRLRVEGLPAPFLKRLRLEGSGDRRRWTVLVADGTLFDLPEERLVRTEVAFRTGELQYLRLTWDDRSSAVVPLPRAAAARVVTAAAAQEIKRAPAGFERRPSEPGRSRFRLHLPGSNLPVVALELGVGGGHLLRAARVTEPRLSGAEVVPQSLGEHTLQRALRGGLAAADLRIPIARPAGADLDLVVDDGDNPPLELLKVEAELAPLPWIYFESATGEALTARFGNAKLAAPQYDLEAMRRSVDVNVPEARWGEARDLPPAEAGPEPAGDSIPITGAPLDTASFAYRRTIPAGPPGLTAVALDAAVLAHIGDLGEMRIADAKNRQVPYVVERLDEPLSIDLADLEPLPVAEEAEQRRESRYRLVLPYDGLPASRLVLSTSARVFDRHVDVAIERPPADPRSRPSIVNVASARWRHAQTDERAPDLVLALPALGSAEAVLVVDEGDNSALPILKPRLLLPAHRLRFFRSGGEPLALLYGMPGLEPPRYDLALLAPRVLGETAREVFAEPEAIGAKKAEPRSALSQTNVFWGALLLAVAALLAIIVRLVGKGGVGNTSTPSA